MREPISRWIFIPVLILLPQHANAASDCISCLPSALCCGVLWCAVLWCRILSAWFYRGHSPNLDFFQVRPEFKAIKEGKRPRVTFAEYIEMPEYQNIQTRMLGCDSFPYRNITITEKVPAIAAENDVACAYSTNALKTVRLRPHLLRGLV